MALDIAGTTLQFDTGAASPSSHTFNLGGRGADFRVGQGTEKALKEKFKGVRQDCIARAMAIGLNLAYEDVYEHLGSMQRMNPRDSRIYQQLGITPSRSPDVGVANFDYEPLLEAAGFKPLKVSDSPKVNRRNYSGPRFKDLVDELVKTEVGRNLSLLVTSPTHMGAIKSGSLHDAWDSSKEAISEIFVREQDLQLPEVKKALDNIARKVGKTVQDLVSAGSFIDDTAFAQYQEFQGIQQRKTQRAQSDLASAKPATPAIQREAPKIAGKNAQVVREISSASKNIESGARSIENVAKSVERTAEEIRRAAREINSIGGRRVSSRGSGVKEEKVEIKVGETKGGGGTSDTLQQRMSRAFEKAVTGVDVATIVKDLSLPEREVTRGIEEGIFRLFERQNRDWIEQERGRNRTPDEILTELGLGKIIGSKRQKESWVGRGLYRNITEDEKMDEALNEAQRAMAEKKNRF